MERYEKILGGFLGAAVGDAMGAATETRSMEQIKSYFGGYVKEFLPPPDDTFARGRKPGQITDDFSLAYYMARAIIKSNGVVNQQVAKDGLLDWAGVDEYYIPFAGPTTRAAIEEFRGNKVQSAGELVINNSKATNGSAMKIFPVGLLNAGNIQRAIEDAVEMSMPTHGNSLSVSGACAVAAAVSRAMDGDADVYNIVQSGLYGAREGERMGKERGIAVAGPSVARRLELAVEIGLKRRNIEEAMRDIGDIIGSGLHISEAVPAAFGLFVAAEGNAMECIYAGVNVGNDTDTVATIVGAIAGTLRGYKSMPKEYLDIINERNNMDLGELSHSLEKLVRQ
jgi:ADP-ribosylglycohydrolase